MWAGGTASALGQGQDTWAGSGKRRRGPDRAPSAVGDRERARQQATARCEPGRGSFAPCFSCCPRRPPTRAPSAAPLSGSIGWPKLGSAQAHLPSTRASLKQSALQSR